MTGLATPIIQKLIHFYNLLFAMSGQVKSICIVGADDFDFMTKITIEKNGIHPAQHITKFTSSKKLTGFQVIFKSQYNLKSSQCQ